MVETGGYEYYMKYRRGTHELRRVLNEDDDDYEVVHTGNYESCLEKMAEIKAENIEYDYNL